MIRIENLFVEFTDFSLSDINLTVEEGTFFILMGPTGAGKTVLLEAIAGLIPVKSGTITIGTTAVTTMPPEKRGVGIMYQDYALFDHLDVEHNIMYGLRYHSLDAKRTARNFDRLIEELGLSRLLKRSTVNLSGGEKQRVALARALIVEPAILLLDEPLAALDPAFREDIRQALKRLHRESGVTFLMVTHDFSEALSLADKAAVVNRGSIEQIGSIEDIFQRPLSAFVADFVGMKNLFPARFTETQAIVNGLSVELGKIPQNGQQYIAIRPEDIVLSREPYRSSMRNTHVGRVTAIVDHGMYQEVAVTVENVTFISLVTKRSLLELDIHRDMPITIAFKTTAIHMF
jgi:molybdate/tungstate transport system ATP-binding protein